MKKLTSCLMILFFIGAAQAELFNNWDFEAGYEYWNTGASDGGYVGIADDDNGPSAPGTHCAYLSTEGVGGEADIRSFDLAVPAGETVLYYSFDYKVDLTDGDGVRYQLRFFEGAGNAGFKGENNIILGDTGGQWLTEIGQYTVPTGAFYTDVRISANVFEGFEGVAKIDNVWVSATDFPPSRLAAHDPDPEDGAENVGVSPDGLTVNADLSWATGLNPDNLDEPNPEIVTHYLYMSSDQTVTNDPNLFLIDAVVATGARDGTTVTDLDFDGLYLWSVEEGIDMGDGSAYPAGDPNNIAGPVWSFTARSRKPDIITQPVSVLADAGDDVVFSIDASSIAPVVYQWYRSTDAVPDPQTDLAVGGNDPELELLDVQLTDEAYYYCEVFNEGDPENAVLSDVVTLGIRRQMAHWTLDAADYDAATEQYADISGQGRNALAGGTPTFVDGIVTGDQDPENFKTDGAVRIEEANGWAFAGYWNPAKFSNQFTISGWFLWDQTGEADFNTIVAKRDDWGFDTMMFMLHLHAPTARIIMETPGGGWVGGADNSVEPNQWYHVVAVYDADGPASIYLNGEVSAQIPSYLMGTGVETSFWIGRNNQIAERFGGILDDLQVYNYAFEWTDAIDLYYAETGEAICLPDQRPSMDITGNCRVGLEDFAVLASEWLLDGLYPEAP